MKKCTSRRGDPCHNQQLGRAAGGNSVGHCPRGPVGGAAPHAHTVLRDTNGWQDYSPQTPEMRRKERERVEVERESMQINDRAKKG